MIRNEDPNQTSRIPILTEMEKKAEDALGVKEKFCRDCKFFERGINAMWQDKFSRCGHPETILRGPDYFISGKSEKPYASICRSFLCGPQAKFWEKK